MERSVNLHSHGSKYQRSGGAAAWDTSCSAQGQSWEMAKIQVRGKKSLTVPQDVTSTRSHECGLLGRGGSQPLPVPLWRRQRAPMGGTEKHEDVLCFLV